MAHDAVRQIIPSRCKSADLRGMALCAWSTVLARVIVVLVRGSAQCQETATTSKPRQVSAVVWPLSSNAPVSTASPTLLEPLPPQLPPEPAPFPVLWGDWPRSSLRRRWVQLLRSQTVMLPSAPLPREKQHERKPPERHTRSQRAHWRLSWHERLARNARPSTAPSLAITVHGLPATFARAFGFALVAAA